MIGAPGYEYFGGIHGESAALENLLAYTGVNHPLTGELMTEALCFGIAGGIGAGYSFCPSVIRYGCGSGVSIVGRHKVYATSAVWYEDFFRRIGASTRITETAAKGKAYQFLKQELEQGRPTVVWCGRPKLPFLGGSVEQVALWMHTFIVYAIDEKKGIAYGSDVAPTPVTLTLDELAAARAGVCSHKNRTLTFDPPPPDLPKEKVSAAIREGMKACAKELLDGTMKTFSLPGLETWAKLCVNDKNKDGWLKVFSGGLLYSALEDVYNSIITSGTGGDLYRGLYAKFLEEASPFLPEKGLSAFASTYRTLGKEWAELAEAALPSKVKPFKKTKELLNKRWKLIAEKGDKGRKQLTETNAELKALEGETKKNFPLSDAEARELLEGMRDRIVDLHRKETEAAQQLAMLSA